MRDEGSRAENPFPRRVIIGISEGASRRMGGTPGSGARGDIERGVSDAVKAVKILVEYAAEEVEREELAPVRVAGKTDKISAAGHQRIHDRLMAHQDGDAWPVIFF